VKFSGSIRAAILVPVSFCFRSLRSVRPGELKSNTGLGVFVYECVVDVDIRSFCGEAEFSSFLASAVTTSDNCDEVM